MANLFGSVLMAAITFPISYFVARGCLRGLVRVFTGSNKRDVL